MDPLGEMVFTDTSGETYKAQLYFDSYSRSILIYDHQLRPLNPNEQRQVDQSVEMSKRVCELI